MTTHSENADDQKDDSSLNWHTTLTNLLDPYEPAADEKSSDEQWSTEEIMEALERHYAVEQGTLSAVYGQELVSELLRLGYKAVNTGALKLQWLFKLKKIVSPK